jgi:hypothetical protein
VASEAQLLATVTSRRATADRAGTHLEDTRRAYRAACWAAWEGGVTVTRLARHVGTSWSRMSETLERARAEQRGLPAKAALVES